MKLLLHTCCGPCMTAFNEFFIEKGIDYSAYFYNPNIQPYKEYLRRRKTLEDYSLKTGVALFIDESFMQHKWENEFADIPASERCGLCYRIRIGAASRFAASQGFSHFTTTLLISPYQNHNLIKEICTEEARKSGGGFYYEDFRVMFREGQNIAREEGLYRQKYCGCVYSLADSKFRDKINWD